MTREEMEATLLLHGWQPAVTSLGNYAWVKTEAELFDVAVGVDIAGKIFNAIGPFFLNQQPYISSHSFHNVFYNIMAREKAMT